MNNGTEEHAPEFISIKDEIKLENKIKVVDHIDLNRLNKQQKPEEKVEGGKRGEDRGKERRKTGRTSGKRNSVVAQKQEREETQAPVARTPKTIIKQPKVETRQEEKASSEDYSNRTDRK